MGKIKTHTATEKRFKVTGSGKVKLNHMNRRHKLGKKAPKRKRILRKAEYVAATQAKTIKNMMPYA
jgi:large subunit ribosomal protein L35